MRLIGIVATALVLVLAPAAPLSAQTIAWTQFAAEGLEARAMSEQSTCPTATIDGVEVPMQVRAPAGNAYPMTVCAVTVPATAKALSVDGAAIGLPPAAPKRIAVIGDTGCRLKGSYVQACNDPAQWPFKQVADAVAAQKPDLIIHVGDYHYRETACPAGNGGCAGSPFGDSWEVWRQDFFAPAARLLPVAPWVMVRGNHEDCERGGKGWSRLLEPTLFDAKAGCNGPSAPYIAQFSNVALAIVDVALAGEILLDAKQVDIFRAQYASLVTRARGPMWLLQHRPIWSTGGTVAGFPFGDNKTLAAAATGTLPPQMQLILSGHHHIFQVLSYTENLPLQIVSGHGGDYLNSGRPINPAGWSINGVTVKNGVHQPGQFGFAMLEPQGEGWVITNYDVTGKALQRCSLIGRQAACLSE